VTDRPFARTVFSLASKRFSGDLIVQDRRSETRVVWTEGQIVAARSASPADGIGRQALTHGLVNSSILGVFVQELAKDPTQDEAALLAQLANLSDAQCITLKHHVLVRSASRIFAFPNASFVVDNMPSMAADPQLPPLDVRWLIYFGLRTHYGLERLATELGVLGSRTVSVSPEAEPHLAAFGFGDYEQHVLAKLRSEPMSLANLLAADLDPNIVHCVVYALVASGYVTYGSGSGRRKSASLYIPPEPTRAAPAPTETPADVRPPQARGRSRRTSGNVVAETVKGVGFIEDSGPTVTASPKAPPTPSPISNERPKRMDTSADVETTTALVQEKLRVITEGGNHYEILGLNSEAADSDVRKSYFQLARRLHPDRLQSLGVTDMVGEIQSVFASINEAFKILSNPKELAHYKKVLAAGGQKAFAAKQEKAEALAMKIFEAEEHFHLGEMALRRDQFGTAETAFAKACDLAPDESEYQALYAWAMYCNASDRESVEGSAMGKMSSALLKSPKSVTTRLYHAKLLKIMGRIEEATASFRVLLKMSPGHREAELELRVLADQAKENSGSKGKKGFFGR